MDKLIERALDHKKWVVLGASGNRDRFGFKILKRLMGEGYEVIPVSPNYDEILGLPVTKSLSDLPEGEYVLDVVVNKDILAKEMEKVDFSKFHSIFLQPKTWDLSTIEAIRAVNPNLIYGTCVLVELNERS